MNRRWVVLGLLGLAGCATLPPPRLLTPAAGTMAELEPLYLAWPTAQGLTIRVASRGCTAKADWTFYVERDGHTARLAFARKGLDVCRSSGGQVDLAFTWAELGLTRGAEVALLNPLVR
ncbi:hypothetical protein ACO2Q0_15255 [Phenylobacterium sp. VNQ135]|uniref:hypothetical protein n=1 Tax=Phenylobacterium sp. VNQ135 TaxID=3400922 RepID=UPI003C0A5DFC